MRAPMEIHLSISCTFTEEKLTATILAYKREGCLHLEQLCKRKAAGMSESYLSKGNL